ncbi:MAG: heavy metal translocating P-type ATPase [Candidatus Promineifilaceae bacterium]
MSLPQAVSAARISTPSTPARSTNLLRRRNFLTALDSTPTSVSLKASKNSPLSDADNISTQTEEKILNRELAAALIGFGAAAANPFVALPLAPIAAGGIVFPAFGIMRESMTKLVKEQTIDVQMISSLGIVGLLATNYLVMGASSLVLLTAGRKLILRTQDRSRKTLIDIFGEQPNSVWLVQNETEIKLPFSKLKANDVIAVTAGQMIPIDGEIVKGEAAIDQQRLTGEAQPVEKTVGDTVLAATLVLSGQVHIRVQQTGDQTVAAQIGHILNNTLDYRTDSTLRFQKLTDRMAAPVLGLSGLAALLIGPAGGVALLNNFPTTSVSLISSLNVMTYLTKTSRLGVLVKDGRALETLKQIDTVVFDKTGTLTLEKPTVGKILACGSHSEEAVLRYAASAEIKQTHPIAQAILHAAQTQNIELYNLDHTRYDLGFGLTTSIQGQQVRVGSQRFIDQCGIDVPANILAHQAHCDVDGVSLVYVAIEEQLGGVIELHPTLRPEAQTVIDALQTRGLTPIIISGDRDQPTQKLATQLGIDSYFAEVLPQDKGRIVEALQAEGRKVCFIGDGINDTIALKQADASISLAGATSAATDTAQMVLMDGTLTQLPQLFNMSDDFHANTNHTLQAMLTPAMVSAFGVFFLHTGIGFAIVAFNVGFFSAVATALLPAWRVKEQNNLLPD